ncbi:hypothetical protein PVAG01_05563 [Phlyctema vagabunda]|uniref:Uncharacterized protein n=1 Tax=Phlyctema vagabunda TaxID=108571 RepID=A0ABR4PLK1_9HELO
MSAQSDVPDEGILGDSTYDFIDTDEESRDDNATESVASTDYIASTDYRGTDDVASWVGTERSEDISDDEDGPDDEAASIPTYAGLDQPTDTPTLGRSSAVLLEDFDKPLAQSIEFEEPFVLGAENVSVKHTVEDFNEDETADIARATNMQNPPKRMVLTIQQTMAQEGLLTKEPFRILYVGSESAKDDILHKIGSSVMALVDRGPRSLRQSAPSQLYSVVQISAFGSEQGPDVHLMPSSRYQIKPESCVAAETQPYEDAPGRPEMIKLSVQDINDDISYYHSVLDGDDFIIEPNWELPHVAVFYCADGDDIEAKLTRTITRKFLNRHNVPSIVVSHKKLHDRSHCMALDQHSIHMCLESRDTNGRGNIIHQRLPIDLESFLNIDARQMNRNLAFITGLHESVEASTVSTVVGKAESPLADSQTTEKAFEDNALRSLSSHGLVRTLSKAFLPVSLLLMAVFVGILTGVPTYRPGSKPAISINSIPMPIYPISVESSALSNGVPQITDISTSVEVKTATRTITITEAKASGPNSLSVLPSMDLGKLTSSISSIQRPTKKITICGAEILGDREVLIRIPSDTKLSWLTKEAMSVNLSRANLTVDFERIYISDDGLVLSLAKNEAYGVLNISIITTKKPIVNETFQVDFGTNMYQNMQITWNRFSRMIPTETSISNVIGGPTQGLLQIRLALEKTVEATLNRTRSTKETLTSVKDTALRSGERLTAFVKEATDEATQRSFMIAKEVSNQLSHLEATLSENAPSIQGLREPFEGGLLSAQVQSKLIWLKLQGKHVEYTQYKQRAQLALRSRNEEARRLRRTTCAQNKARKASEDLAKKAIKRLGRN